MFRGTGFVRGSAMTTTTTTIDTKLTVRRCIHIAAPPARIWQEFEDQDRMSRWWGTGRSLVAYEPREGGRIEMEVEVGGVLTRFGGRITVFAPGREPTWEDNWIGPLAWSTTIFSTLRLTPAPGGTIVEFIKHGFERLGDKAAVVHRGLEGGWSITQLDALRRIVDAS
jgi:uncharacterized protein YndB with AHSA1/START domain